MLNIITVECDSCGCNSLCVVEFHPQPIAICADCQAAASQRCDDDEDEMTQEEYDRVYADVNDYDDSMDGDFDSGMASAGYGTDEDYGYYGGNEDY